jgi:hypothetical protein
MASTSMRLHHFAGVGAGVLHTRAGTSGPAAAFVLLHPWEAGAINTPKMPMEHQANIRIRSSISFSEPPSQASPHVAQGERFEVLGDAARVHRALVHVEGAREVLVEHVLAYPEP